MTTPTLTDSPPPEEQHGLRNAARYVRYASYGFRAFAGLILLISVVGLIGGSSTEEGSGFGFVLAFLLFGEVLRFVSRKLETEDQIDMPTIAMGVFGSIGLFMIAGGLIMVFDDPGGFALMAFGLVFAGLPYFVYRHTRRPPGQKSVSVASQTSTHQHMGMQRTRKRTVLINVDADATEDEVEQAKQQWMHERWERRPDWVSGRIEAEDALVGNLIYWMAGLWCLVAAGLIGAYLLWQEPPWIFAVIPALIALGLCVVAIRTHLRRRKFGTSHFIMEASPSYLGERLVGSIETGVQERHRPPDGFQVRLACLERYKVRTSNDNEHTQENVLWETKQALRGTPYPGLPRRLSVAIDLPLPTDQPATTLDSDREGIVWQLELKAAVPGVDYATTFRLPVFDRAHDPTHLSSDPSETDEKVWS